MRENALEAFHAAADIGYRYIETDVRTSKDGVPFVFHDPDLRRMTGHKARLEDLTAIEIGELSFSSGDAVPTLANVLESFPDLRFNIDLKDGAAIDPVARLVVQSRSTQRVCITSFSERRIEAVRRILPDVCTGLGIGGVFKMIATWPLRRRASPGGAAVLQVPLRYRGVALVTPNLIRRAHQIGLAVHVWTLNDRQSIEAALDVGVDGIMTDRLELLKEVLISRDLWSTPK